MKRTALARKTELRRTSKLKTAPKRKPATQLKRTAGPRKQKPSTARAEARLRKIVWERDGGKCRMMVYSFGAWASCQFGITDFNPLDVVHVFSRAKFPEAKHDPDNALLGCRASHDAYDGRRRDISATVPQDRFNAARVALTRHGKSRKRA